jgi:hypothetical protein
MYILSSRWLQANESDESKREKIYQKVDREEVEEAFSSSHLPGE